MNLRGRAPRAALIRSHGFHAGNLKWEDARIKLRLAYAENSRQTRDAYRLELTVLRWRRHNAERSAACYWRDYRETHRVQRAANNRAYRARKQAYLEDLFAE